MTHYKYYSNNWYYNILWWTNSLTPTTNYRVYPTEVSKGTNMWLKSYSQAKYLPAEDWYDEMRIYE